MHNRYSDFEELRPTGEASHIPDEKLDDGCDGDPRRQRVATSTGATPMHRWPPTASAGPVERQSQTGRRNADSVSPTMSGVTPPARTRPRRRFSGSSTCRRVDHVLRRCGEGRRRGEPPHRQRGGAGRRRLHAHLQSRRGACAPAGREMALTPQRGTGVVRRGRAASPVPPRTGQAGTGRKHRSSSSSRRGSTTSVGTASATRRVSTRSSTTPTTRCGWFQRWR